MTAIGATEVGVTAVRNDLKLWIIIIIGSTIVLWWSLFLNTIQKQLLMKEHNESLGWCCLLSVVCCPLSAVYCLLSAVHCLLSAVCHLMSAVCHLLSAVHCCCLLYVLWCLLHIGDPRCKVQSKLSIWGAVQCLILFFMKKWKMGLCDPHFWCCYII